MLSKTFKAFTTQILDMDTKEMDRDPLQLQVRALSDYMATTPAGPLVAFIAVERELSSDFGGQVSGTIQLGDIKLSDTSLRYLQVTLELI